MNERKSYTAQEMREMEAIVASGDIGSMTRERVAIMLKQAVEMRERAEEVRAKHSIYYGKIDYENETAIVDEVDYILRGAEGKELKMASESETVADIAKMMRRNEEVFHHLYWCEYADRVETAHQREISELREENKRLRAALKPVLKCKVLSAMTVEVKPGRSEYCATIIEKVQHIYNDGEAKQKKGEAK